MGDTGRKSLLLIVCVSLIASAAAARDCSLGCPLVADGDGVCGANGVTYATACLAECSGTDVAYAGPCGSSSGSGRSGGGGAGGAPVPLAESPVGRFLAAGAPGSARSRAAVLTATPADIARFSAEGLVLAGVAPQAPALAGGALLDVTSKPLSPIFQKGADDPSVSDLRSVRVESGSGLVYVSAAPLRAGGARAAAPPPGGVLKRAGDELYSPAALPPAGARRAAQTCVDAAAAHGDASVSPRVDAPWVQVPCKAAYPLSAIGALLTTSSTYSARCSASLFGAYSVITAAHCVYLRSYNVTMTGGLFRPGLYVDAQGSLVTPYGSSEVSSIVYLSGWRTSEGIMEAFIYDSAVILLKTNLGGATGTMGLRYKKNGVGGRMFAAGYPAETPTPYGRYYQLDPAQKCKVWRDGGGDNAILFRPKKFKACTSACGLGEQGQSGEPVYKKHGKYYYTYGTLSYGPAVGTCYGYDTYYEFDQTSLEWATTYTLWTPTK